MATPTRNENPGWIRSCSEQPAHSAWVWLKARIFQNQLAGNASEMRENCRTSAIMSSITKPRYASTATLRTAGWRVRMGSAATGAASATVDKGHLPYSTISYTKLNSHTINLEWGSQETRG